MQTTPSLIITMLSARYDPFGPVHHRRRRSSAALMDRLGTADHLHDQTSLLGVVRAHLAILGRRSAVERTAVWETLDDKDVAAAAIRRHGDQRAAHAMLEMEIRAVAGVGHGRAALASGRQLHLSFSRVVAAELVALAELESVAWPLLCARLADAGLIELGQVLTQPA